MRKYARIKRRKEEQRKIAGERIKILKRMIKQEPDFAPRYRELISKIRKKYRIKDKKDEK
ncbi:MAG: hypothetical protein ACE5J7_03965 [Candidatus Aenigmatarchaeota archaeon]